MSSLSVVAGVAVLLWTISDIFSTVFVIGDGAGHQSSRVADWIWRAALRFHDPASPSAHRRLRRVGPIIVLCVLTTWVGQLIVGWALVFIPSSFTSSSATIGDRIAFAGRTIVGRAGNSPALEASSGSWEALHGIAGLSGVTMVSIGLAYVLPILAGVAHKRAVGVYVHTLGNSVDDMRNLASSAARGGQFELHLIALTPLVAAAAERHRAYPVLHYFHSTDRHAALAPAVAKIALLVRNELDAEDVDRTVTGPLARALHDLFGALTRMGLEDFAHRLGLDVESGEVGVDALEKSNYALPTLAWLEAYVTFDGWEWDEVTDGDQLTHS